MTEKVPGWLERVLLPRLSKIFPDHKSYERRFRY